MALKIYSKPDGSYRPEWYGRFVKDGRRGKSHEQGKQVTVNLHVPVEGRPPRDESGRVDLSKHGDNDFEKSRRAARSELRRIKADFFEATKKNEVEAATKLLEEKTGERIDNLKIVRLGKGKPLEDFASYWEENTSAKTELWKRAVKTFFRQFADFARTEAEKAGSKCETINDITPDIARSWVRHLRHVYAHETIARKLYTLRATFDNYVAHERDTFAADVKANPFDAIKVGGGGERKNRRPLTETELARLFEAASDDDFFYPLIVCAACTGLRVEDICGLKWKNVNLKDGLIDLKTKKTGTFVTIPIFDRLREVLEKRTSIDADGARPSPYVFPAAWRRYQESKDGIYRPIKPYMCAAIYGGGASGEASFAAVEVGDDGTADATNVRDIAKAIETANFTQRRRDNVLEVYRRFKNGEKSASIADALGISRSRVSMYLEDAEGLTGERLRPVASIKRSRLTKDELKDVARGDRTLTDDERKSLTRRDMELLTRFVPDDGERDTRQKSASLYGWHSLRATFVVLAIEAGVPLASVQKIVGHSTFSMTLEYFNPEQKHEAERVKKQMRGSILNKRSDAAMLTNSDSATLTTTPAAKPDALDALLNNLTDEQRLEIARRLFATSRRG